MMTPGAVRKGRFYKSESGHVCVALDLPGKHRAVLIKWLSGPLAGRYARILCDCLDEEVAGLSEDGR